MSLRKNETKLDSVIKANLVDLQAVALFEPCNHTTVQRVVDFFAEHGVSFSRASVAYSLAERQIVGLDFIHEAEGNRQHLHLKAGGGGSWLKVTDHYKY